MFCNVVWIAIVSNGKWLMIVMILTAMYIQYFAIFVAEQRDYTWIIQSTSQATE